MRHNKTKLNQTELKNLLEQENPELYDEIRILFNNHNEIRGWDLKKEHGYCFKHWDEKEGEITDLKKPYYFKNDYFYILNKILSGADAERYEYEFITETYNNIKSVICFNYNDNTITNYTGEKMDKISSTKELKEFFMKNQKQLKYTNDEKTNYGGSVINGVGARKVMINDEFYSYKQIYDVLTGNEVNHNINHVLRFLIKS